ncbi:MAG: ribosome biogenesis GTP-binding protein YihA/YsxC [Deltaproteobacteria bacterium]|nr:ribosome biogenesis GTP-binding protein YihA/YsxC [Deltaproteobacteria bacterium]NNK86028.1 YihA family ribosome biogenesis GTP-binding protein [Desulfobacterales bacterium]
MIIKSAEFVTSAVKPSQYPPAVLPEVAFAGRSNVGKSSLINTLLNRKRLVKTSSTPGRTQLINFFNINEAFFFVDIPGYGYARVPMAVKKKWGPMIETYITTRKTLKGVVLILDIRRIPGPEEMNMIDWLRHHDIPSVSVLTKSDKLSRSKQQKQLIKITNTLSANKDHFILFSAKSRQGKEEVWSAVKKLIF